MDRGIKRKSIKPRKHKNTRKSKIRHSANKKPLPRTSNIRSRKLTERIKMSRAHTNMSLTELQIMAKSRGIPFGGLSRTKLIKKINNYY